MLRLKPDNYAFKKKNGRPENFSHPCFATVQNRKLFEKNSEILDGSI